MTRPCPSSTGYWTVVVLAMLTRVQGDQRSVKDDRQLLPATTDDSDLPPLAETDMHMEEKRLVHGMNAVPFVRAFHDHVMALGPLPMLGSVKRYSNHEASVMPPLSHLFNGARGFGKRFDPYTAANDDDSIDAGDTSDSVDGLYVKRNLYKLKSLGARGFGR